MLPITQIFSELLETSRYGKARMFGFELMPELCTPYLSQKPSEFWALDTSRRFLVEL